jgi:hypothetical protein
MGRHHRWHKGSRLIGPWAGAWKRSEKRQAIKKLRHRDRQVDS